MRLDGGCRLQILVQCAANEQVRTAEQFMSTSLPLSTAAAPFAAAVACRGTHTPSSERLKDCLDAAVFSGAKRNLQYKEGVAGLPSPLPSVGCTHILLVHPTWSNVFLQFISAVDAVLHSGATSAALKSICAISAAASGGP